tara:strand:+ start:166 stop:1566 length:1401 start_codon:yes stop_codon:yes gene_type:complete
MNICIIGTGVSGLMTACELLNLDFVEKITIIGSSKIPPIKVGESTTISFDHFVEKNFTLKEFVQSSDAAVKYGVYYKNWSKNSFIHYFDSHDPFSRYSTHHRAYCETLSNKDPNIHLHDLISNKLWNFIQKNEVSLDKSEHPHSWHFDAGKLKLFMKNYLSRNEKVSIVDDKIVDCKFLVGDRIQYIIGKNNKKYTADYFVNCCGDNETNEKVFKEKYVSLSSYLLTNKAVVFPIKYKNKKKQFHPYTVAKTMNNGWRWITPTQSRIGTGYVFSDKHISVEEATNEFLEDIGDKTLKPFVVDFDPKYNEKPFKTNSCTIGMSSGFLEPLDAPGLAFTCGAISSLIKLLKGKESIEKYNFLTHRDYEFWCSFILHQYKTCHRNDTQFWIDQKNVKCDFYDQIINSLYYVPSGLFERYEYEMFFKTTAGKDIQWKSMIKNKPYPIEQIDTEVIHHLDYIQSFYNERHR